MIDLSLSDESKQYKELAQDFFQNEVAPRAEKLDHEKIFPMEIYEKISELGLLNPYIPESYGGLGLNLWDSCVVAEEAGAACMGVSTAILANVLAVAPLIVQDKLNKLQTNFLEMLSTETKFAGFIFSSRSNADFVPCVSASFKKKANSYVLSGKNLIALNGSKASWFFVLANNEEDQKFAAFAFPAQMQGIHLLAQINKIGLKAADICFLDIDSLELSEEHLIGDSLGDSLRTGSDLYLNSLTFSAPLMASFATGLMNSALKHSIKYANERQTFGKPISQHQSISFMLADMARYLQSARLLAWRAASLYDQGLRDRITAMSARTYALDLANTVANDAVQIFGGYGYSKEYPVEKLMRDAKMMHLIAGTNYELKLSLAQELLVRG